MQGGIGNDLYVVGNILDRAVEQADGRHDIVRASVSYQLPAHVEDLELTGTAAVAGTGNAAQRNAEYLARQCRCQPTRRWGGRRSASWRGGW